MNDEAAEAAVKTVLELLAIPGEPGREGAVAEFIKARLVCMGVPEKAVVFDRANAQSEIGGQIGNMIVRLDGHGKGDRIMLCTHLDTVPNAVGCKPRRQGGRIVNDAPGRALGADARAGCAILLSAAQTLMARKGGHPPFSLVFFVQEEIGLVGSRYLDTALLGGPLPSMCFNFDGSPMDEVVYKVIGTERTHIRLKGVPAHAKDPRQGISCAVIMAEALAELEREGWNGYITKPAGEGRANLGVIQGGTGSNVVLPALYCLAEARSFDADFLKTIVARWKDAFSRAVDRANEKGKGVRGRASVEFAPGPFYAPYELPKDSPVIKTAADVLRQCGLEPRLVVDAGGQDTCHVVAGGIPSAGLSYGGFEPHSEKEYLDVPQFLKGCEIASAFVDMFSQRP